MAAGTAAANGRARGKLASVFRFALAWRRMQLEDRELASLSERELRDIGCWRLADAPSPEGAPATAIGRLLEAVARPIAFVALGAAAIAVILLARALLDLSEALPSPEEILTMAAVFAGSLVAGLGGFAFSAITGSLVFHWLSPAAAIPLLLACSIMTQLFSIGALWASMRWADCAKLLLGGLPGIPIGAYILQTLRPGQFATGFGAILACYAAYLLLRPQFVVRRGGTAAALAVGFAGGITGGAAAFPGAVPTIWCCLRALPKEVQRGTIQPFILLMQGATILYFSHAGLFGHTTMVSFAWCAPAVVLGTWLGIRLYRRIDDAMFRRILLCLLVVSGLALVL
jgi:uncharacterized membrane protein YfcA/uncharacterized protein YjiS (DUF1127 family)